MADGPFQVDAREAALPGRHAPQPEHVQVGQERIARLPAVGILLAHAIAHDRPDLRCPRHRAHGAPLGDRVAHTAQHVAAAGREANATAGEPAAAEQHSHDIGVNRYDGLLASDRRGHRHHPAGAVAGADQPGLLVGSVVLRVFAGSGAAATGNAQLLQGLDLPALRTRSAPHPPAMAVVADHAGAVAEHHLPALRLAVVHRRDNPGLASRRGKDNRALADLA